MLDINDYLTELLLTLGMAELLHMIVLDGCTNLSMTNPEAGLPKLY